MDRLLTTEELNARRAELVGKRYPVLSHGGVTLIDFMGSDQRVVEAARTTSDLKGKGDKEDRNLIRYLKRHRHSTPLEMCQVTFLIEIPMDAWRQMVRHRTFSINEFSTRYSDVPDINDTIDPDAWRLQSQTNRQGSSDAVVESWPENWTVTENEALNHGDWHFSSTEGDNGPSIEIAPGFTPGEYLSWQEKSVHAKTRAVYAERLGFGVAKEVARKDLALSTYTKLYWTGNMHNLFHFLGLRLDKHAQLEVRQFAMAIGEIMSQIFPVCYQAFLDYQHNAMFLTALDILVIQRLQGLVGTMVSRPYSLADFRIAQHPDWVELEKCRERDECLAKLQQLGLVDTK